MRLISDVARLVSHVLDHDEGVVLYHGWRVGLLSGRIADMLGLDNASDVFFAGLLHDVGGIGLRDHVVHHAALAQVTPGAIAHVRDGVRILEESDLLSHLAPFVADHHERYDGHGYPTGKGGPDIPIEAGIITFADTFDVRCRWELADRRKDITAELCSWSAGRLCDERVSQAASALFGAEPNLVDDLFDAETLTRMVTARDESLQTALRRSFASLVSELLWFQARVLDRRDAFSVGHSQRVAFYASAIADALASEELGRWDMLWAGLLHDVGMVAVPRDILDHPGPLGVRQWSVVRAHAHKTESMAHMIRDLAHLSGAAASHHEHWDGSGYPHGWAQGQIPLMGRILAYATAYDSLTSDRAYRAAMSSGEALGRIRSAVGSQFDPELSDIVLPVLDNVGPAAQNLPSSAQEYSRLCRTGAFEAMGSNDPMAAVQVVRPVDQGVLFLPIEDWTSVALDDELNVIDGDRELRKLLPQGRGPFSSLFGEEDARWVEQTIATLVPGSTASRYLFASSGRPFEVVLSKTGQAGQISALVRSAQNRLQSVKRMALFYRNFLNSSQPVFFMDTQGSILDVNRAFLDLYELKVKQTVGADAAHLLGSDDDGVWQDVWAAIVDPNVATWTGEVVHRASSGGRIPMHMTASAIRDARGEHVGYVVQTIDLRGHKEAEARMEALNHCLASLDTDHEGNFERLVTTVSKALHADFGFYGRMSESGDELVATWHGAWTDPVAEVPIAWRLMMKPHEGCLLYRSDNAPSQVVAVERETSVRFDLRVAHLVRRQGQVVGLVCLGFVEDRGISTVEKDYVGTVCGALGREEEKLQADQALQVSEQRYRLLSENASDLIWSLDRRGRFLYVNRAIEQFAAVNRDALVGHSIRERLPVGLLRQVAAGILGTDPDWPENLDDAAMLDQAAFDSMVDSMWAMVASRQGRPPARFDVEFAMPGRDRVFLEVVWGVVRDDEGRNEFVHGVAHDVSERRKREMAMEMRASELEELSRLKSELIAATSHDLKAPVTGMLSYVNLIRDRLPDLDVQELTRYLDRIEVTGHALLDLITDVLDLTRIDAGLAELDRTSVDLVEVGLRCSAMHEAVAQERAVQIRVDMDPALPLIEGDDKRLEQVLCNLISNAVRFAPDGTQVEILGRLDGPKWVSLQVQDRGCGIPAQEMEHIFDRFHRAGNQPSGAKGPASSGLGLAIVRGIVALHGGRVWAENRSEGGARFTVVLPIEDRGAHRPMAMVADPTGVLFDRLAAVLRRAGVQVRWLVDFAVAFDSLVGGGGDVLFVSDAALDADETADLLPRLTKLGQADHPAVVVVGRADDARTVVGAQHLVEPILDEEIIHAVRRAVLDRSGKVRDS